LRAKGVSQLLSFPILLNSIIVPRRRSLPPERELEYTFPSLATPRRRTIAIEKEVFW